MQKTTSIAKRLALCFGVVIAMFFMVAAVSLFTASRLKDADELNKHTYVVLDHSGDLLTSMVNMETSVRGFLLSGNEGHLGPWQEGRKRFEENWRELKRLTADNPTQQGRLTDMLARHDQFTAAAESLIALRRDVNEGRQPAQAVSAAFNAGRDKAAMDAFRSIERDFQGAERRLLGERGEHAENLRLINMLTNVLGGLLGLITAVSLDMWLARSITRPINEAVKIAEAVAAGDLTTQIDVKGEDETGRLLAALQRMNTNLASLVDQVRLTSDSIVTGSGHIASGNADLSQRTEQQASNLQQTAASMEQLNATVRNNADTAHEATELAGRAREAAGNGGEVVDQVVCTMEKISASSRKIGDIIAVIDGIAFQTNILALNAAVEAARAGEQGRGFAVVATEVRNLAQRSANAAREIKSLISESVETVETGARLVSDAGRSMADIVEQVNRVGDLIQEISVATREQTSGIGQVSDAITQLDQVTQQNAALVEQSATAADQLKANADELARAVGAFRLR